MLKYYSFLFLLAILFGLNSCSKQEVVRVLQDKYEPGVKEPEFKGEDFIVDLNARALQAGEHGEWKILDGVVMDNYVSIEDKANPFTKFKGMPGEEYTLEWTRWTKDGNARSVQTKVKIPALAIEIIENTSSKFETIRSLSVNPKYKGTWSFDGAYAQLTSNYHDGYAEPTEKKPSVELHGYANTSYTAVYKYTYAGKVYQFQKVIKTGNYTEDEGLYELQLSRGNKRVIEDNFGNIIELNLQASGIAWIFEKPNTYPALQAFKKLRKLFLGGSSLKEIPSIFGDYYLDLEELNMDRMGDSSVFPENFGNLTKLKVLFFMPMNMASGNSEVLLPKSFANLKALESFTVKYAGNVNFNGTLGKLSSLKMLNTSILSLTEDIGDLKELEHVELFCKESTFPQRFSECRSLTFVRISFDESAYGNLVLSSKIGDLKKLETLELTTNKMRVLPDSFSELTALKNLSITALSLQSIPENFGNLSNLETLTIYGNFTKIPNSFGNLKKLSVLFLSGKAETLPESFGDLSSLSYFNAETSSFKALPVNMGKLKKLKEINLRSAKIESLPASFGELDALEVLNLSGTQLKTFPKSIIPLKNIRNINLNSTSVGDIPDDISKMKTGVVFNLYQIPNLTLDHLKYILTISKGKVYATEFGYFSTGN
jgi:Leucine-rich repeat (LRR) protein